MCFFYVTATTDLYTYCHTLSLLDALPILLGVVDAAPSVPSPATSKSEVVLTVSASVVVPISSSSSSPPTGASACCSSSTTSWPPSSSTSGWSVTSVLSVVAVVAGSSASVVSDELLGGSSSPSVLWHSGASGLRVHSTPWLAVRSEERRVGEECVSRCSTR